MLITHDACGRMHHESWDCRPVQHCTADLGHGVTCNAIYRVGEGCRFHPAGGAS